MINDYGCDSMVNESKISIHNESVDVLKLDDKEELLERILIFLSGYKDDIEQFFEKIVIKGENTIDGEVFFPHFKVIVYSSLKEDGAVNLYDRLAYGLQGLDDHILLDLEGGFCGGD